MNRRPVFFWRVVLLLSLLGSFALAQPASGFKGVVVGDALEWEGSELLLTLEVSELAQFKLDIHSPGFDPNDYRSALQGQSELGDERYDKGAGSVQATFQLLGEAGVIVEKKYGVEAHRTDNFATVLLQPGRYTLKSTLAGLAKNAFVYSVSSDPDGAAQLYVEPNQLLVDPQATGTITGMNYTIPRGDWTTPFSITVPENPNPVVASIYDGDGAAELLFRLTSPDGATQDMPVSGDKTWLEYSLDQIGDYDFAFRVPESAGQYSNTIGLRVDKRLRIEGTQLRVVRPAIFTLTKTVDKMQAVVGETLNYTIEVRNEGDTLGNVTLGDVLPAGLEGESLEETFTLYAGQSKAFKVQAVISEGAPEQIINTATLMSDAQTLSAEAVTTLQAEPVVEVSAPPIYEITKTANRTEVMVGDSVIFTTTVTNTGGTKGEVTLSDILPEGLAGVGLEQTFVLSPGDSREFIIAARVLDTAADVLENEVTITDGVSTASATAMVTVVRPLVVVPEIEVTPPAGAEGTPVPGADPASVVVDPAAQVTPEVMPEEPIVLEDFEASRFSRIDLFYRAGDIITCDLGELAAGESRDVNVVLEALEGTISNSRFSTLAEGLSVRKSDLLREENTVSYTLRVTNPGSETVDAVLTEPLPTGTRFVSGEGCLETTDLAKEILVTHVPPEGSVYDAGSSLLNGAAISDPLVDKSGRLYWVIPYSSEGTITYLVAHSDALPPVEEPTLTVATSDRDLELVGSVPFTDAERALMESAPVKLSSEPLANIQVRPLDVIADNRNPIRLEIRTVDVAGNPVSSDVLTLEANAEFLKPDADPNMSGYQILLNDGKAVLELAPQPSPRMLELRAKTVREIQNPIVLDTTVQLTGVTQGLYQYQVSAIASFGGGVNVAGVARGYAEVPFANGSLQAAVDVGADSVAGFDTDNSLATQVDPSNRYPLLGTGEEAQPALRSDDGVAVRYDAAGFSAGYYSDDLSVPGVASNGRGTALQFETRGDVQVEGFAAVIPSDTRTVEIIPDGTRTYFLGEAVKQGSERVVRRTSEGEETLTRLIDYTINYPTGDITLARPLWSSDGDFNEIRLVVTYAPEDAPRDQLAFGIGASYVTGNVRVGAGISQYGTLKMGIEGAYTSEDFYAKARFTQDFGNDDKAASTAMTFAVGGSIDRLSADLDLTYNNRLSGKGELRYYVTDSGSIYARHTAANSLSRSELGYRQEFDKLRASLGIGYDWIGRYLSGVAGLGYDAGDLDLELIHAQTFSSNNPSQTTFTAKYTIDSNLTAEAALGYAWGNGLSGTIGLEQDLGNANLRFDYQLPTASGDGNRARGGVEVPFKLSDTLDLNAHFGTEFNLNDNTSETAFGAALRYSVETFNATFGAEIAFPSVGGTKVVLRSEASGQLSKDQTIALDANYQIAPELRGRFGVAYALKLGMLNFLTYHRLENNPGKNTLEGEIAPTLVISPAFQVRPAFAYRANFDDTDANTFQATLGGVYYFSPEFGAFNPNLGVGLYGHYVWQPGTDSSDFGATLELSAELTQNIWARVGYTFPGDLEGLTTISRGGFYIGLDLLGAGQF
jgi:uncharacterized repeat protein (TIGR01451 family)